MRPLLALSEAIDKLNEKIGTICNLLVLLACVVSAANAMIRYAFSYSSNGWLEAHCPPGGEAVNAKSSSRWD